MGLEQWGASEQYVAVIHKVLPRKSVFILKNQDYRFLFLREDIKEMEKSNIMIRLEKKEEYQKVENLVRESFWNVYRPGCLEHYVLHQLRNDPAFVPELDQSNGKCSYETDKNLLDDYLKWFCEENAI